MTHQLAHPLTDKPQLEEQRGAGSLRGTTLFSRPHWTLRHDHFCRRCHWGNPPPHPSGLQPSDIWATVPPQEQPQLPTSWTPDLELLYLDQGVLLPNLPKGKLRHTKGRKTYLLLYLSNTGVQPVRPRRKFFSVSLLRKSHSLRTMHPSSEAKTGRPTIPVCQD